MARIVSYNEQELYTKHPELARALSHLFGTKFRNSKRGLNFWLNYAGKYKTKKGELRRVQLGTIIELLEETGFKVEIKVNEIPSKHTLNGNL